MTPTLEQATEFVTRIVRALDAHGPGFRATAVYPAELGHIDAFLSAFERAEEGLRRHAGEDAGEKDCARCFWSDGERCDDRRRWTEARDEAWQGLVRIGDLYGEKPPSEWTAS